MEFLDRLCPEETWSYAQLVEESASNPALVAETVEELGISAVSWVVQTSREATSSVDERERAHGFPPSSTGRSRIATERAFLTLLRGIRRGSSAESLSAPLSADLREIIRANVRHGIPLDALMNRMWSVHSTAKDMLTEAIRDAVTQDELPRALKAISDAAYDFANDFVRQVVVAYEDEQRAWRRRRSDEQAKIIERVVAGDEAGAESDDVLPAHWSGRHVCAVAWLHDARFTDDHDRELAEFAARAARSLGASDVFVYEREGLIGLWWNFEEKADLPDSRMIAELARPRWMRLAIGPVEQGIEGFRTSFNAATQVAGIRTFTTARSVFSCEDHEHLVLMLNDRLAATRFVRRELGALASDEPRVAEIRDTVRRYLVEGNSRVAVAKALHLAPNTIAYRVGQANDLLGRGVNERPTQVLLALQLLDLVPDLLEPRTTSIRMP